MKKRTRNILIVIGIAAVLFIVFKEKPLIHDEVLVVSLVISPSMQENLDEFATEKIMGRKIVFENVDTAMDVAASVEEIWIELFGEDTIKQRPYHVSYDDNNKLWMLRGDDSYLRGGFGGVVYAIVSKETGELLAIWGDE